MPKPRKGEKKSDYMQRCIPMLINEGKDNEQAIAICSNMYDEDKEDMSEDLKDSVWSKKFWEY